MKGYYKIGFTILNSNKYEVYESEEDGNEIDWLLISKDGKKKIYRNALDVILL